MKKILIYILLLITIVSALNSQNIQYGRQFNYPYERGYLIINDNSIIQDDVTYKSKIYKDKYFTFLETDKDKYIVLTCDYGAADFITLVKTSEYRMEREKDKCFFGNWEIDYECTNLKGVFKTMPALTPFSVVRADTHIEETTKNSEKIVYLPELSCISYNPWAVKADEKDKAIYLNTRLGAANVKDDPSAVKEIVIANGFICTAKPYLYEQNSRAKTIRVTNGVDAKIYTLEDTPNFQIVPLNFPRKGKEDWDFKVEILDYYHGTKYSDVVISGIYYVN